MFVVGVYVCVVRVYMQNLGSHCNLGEKKIPTDQPFLWTSKQFCFHWPSERRLMGCKVYVIGRFSFVHNNCMHLRIAFWAFEARDASSWIIGDGTRCILGLVQRVYCGYSGFCQSHTWNQMQTKCCAVFHVRLSSLCRHILEQSSWVCTHVYDEQPLILNVVKFPLCVSGHTSFFPKFTWMYSENCWSRSFYEVLRTRCEWSVFNFSWIWG